MTSISNQILLQIHALNACRTAKVNNYFFQFFFSYFDRTLAKKRKFFSLNITTQLLSMKWKYIRHTFHFLVFVCLIFLLFSLLLISSVDFSVLAPFCYLLWFCVSQFIILFFSPEKISIALSFTLIQFLMFACSIFYIAMEQVLHKVSCYPCGSSQCVYMCVCVCICLCVYWYLYSCVLYE